MLRVHTLHCLFSQNRGTDWYFTSDRSRLVDADAIVFHPSGFDASDLPPRITGQPWILQSMESPSLKFAFFRDS